MAAAVVVAVASAGGELILDALRRLLDSGCRCWCTLRVLPSCGSSDAVVAFVAATAATAADGDSEAVKRRAPSEFART